MKPAMTINNKYFMYTLSGVMLLIGAMGFALTNYAGIATMQLSPILVAGTLAASAISLLTKAIKADKHRLGTQQTANV